MAYTEAHKVAQAKYYQEHKVRRLALIRQRQLDIRETVKQHKLDRGCSQCGYAKSSRALQFHHTEDNKEGNIARWVAQGRSLKVIFAEIEKCVILCSNCHAEVHEDMEGSSTG